MIDIPKEIEPICRRAGWFPERCAPLPTKITERIPQGHPALEVMHAFYLCNVAGIMFGLSDHDFWDKDEWEAALNTQLVCIARCGDGYWWIDSYGRCFVEPYAADFCFAGENIGDAMRRFFSDVRCQPMLLPEQDSAVLYGETYTRDSPELWHY